MNRIFLALAALIFISPCAPATEPSSSAAVVYYGTDRSVPPRDEKLALASFQRHYRSPLPVRTTVSPHRGLSRAHIRARPQAGHCSRTARSGLPPSSPQAAS